MGLLSFQGAPVSELATIYGANIADIVTLHGGGVDGAAAPSGMSLPTPNYYWSMDDTLADEIAAATLSNSTTPSYVNSVYNHGLQWTTPSQSGALAIAETGVTGYVLSAWLQFTAAVYLCETVALPPPSIVSIEGDGSILVPKHMVVISDGSTRRFYRDGVIQNITTVTVAQPTVGYIRYDIPGNYGEIDELCLIINPTVSGTFATWADSLAAELYNLGLGMVYRSGSGWIDPGEAV